MSTVNYHRQTTLITGASSGIGVEFAREFARRGSDVVLVARRLERLEKLAAELNATYGVRAEAIPLDLSLPGAGQTLVEEVERRDLTVTSLVNNAGFGTFGPFHAEEPGRLREEINVNVASVVDISRAFIEGLRASGNGVLINVASMAAYQPIPNMAVYAATKAFVLSFTEALWQESLGTGFRFSWCLQELPAPSSTTSSARRRRPAALPFRRRGRWWRRRCGRSTVARRRPASYLAG